ncbi:MAG TPA: M23 family metallopeptidase [Terriglobia bacterium]|nr:M23 family metallopeptidase [Terriglobia bacterium]
MCKQSGELEAGFGKAALFLIFILFLIVLGLVLKLTSRQGPAIQLAGELKGIGLSTPFEIHVHDGRHRIKTVQVEVRQGGRTFALQGSLTTSSGYTAPWWRFWSRHLEAAGTFRGRVGRREIPDLKEGRATLVISATNDSWGRFFRGGRTEAMLDLPVRFTPPSVEVLTTQHYINQGGCDMVLFKVSPGTLESGVQVKDYFFRSWSVKDTLPAIRMCVFAFPYNVEATAVPRIVARDDAGNETLTNFNYKVFPKKFKSDTINLTDDFLARVVPPIMSQSPEVQDQGNLLRNFLLINGNLRSLDAQQLVAFSQKTLPHFTWTQPFVPLTNAQVEASFADYRTYVYNGQVVDHQTHLGFDLAVVQHTPVVAANDGVIVYAGWFGIYGNAVVIDHGCGIQSLYGHLSSIGVKEGEQVKRGQEIARSGQTGLAGGDHLHFTILLDGVPVNPVEWWDPHWIHDRIMAKLQAYQ